MQNIVPGTRQLLDVVLFVLGALADNEIRMKRAALTGQLCQGAPKREEAELNMHDAIQVHIEGLKEDGLPIPSSSATADYIEVAG